MIARCLEIARRFGATWVADASIDLAYPDGRMPFKSQAQRRKFAQLLVEGKISDKTFEEWNRETGSRKLPERVGRTSTRRKASPVRRKSQARRRRR